MTTHNLKIWPKYYEAVSDGSKRFEYRLNDRDFQVGDVLVLRESRAVRGSSGRDYTGRELRCRVTYILPVPFGGSPRAEDMMVVMSIADVEVTP